MDINKDNLEKSLGNKEAQEAPKMSKEMEIGFHQGALNTLISERNELIRMAQNVDKIVGMHLKRLEELGVKIQRRAPEDKKE